MNTKAKQLHYQFRRWCLKLSSPLIAVAAVGCAILVETEQINYAYPLELVLNSIIKDPVILTTSTKCCYQLTLCQL